MREVQLSLFEDNPEYDAFLDKFETKKTTDDCYTPANVFEAVAAWVESEYGVDRACFVRPFWPDGDYENFDYPEGCIVVDNPPFSIRAQIIDFYLARGVRFFLFSPALTLLTRHMDITHIAVGATITYANGAEVPTSFVTDLEPGVLLRTAPALSIAVEAANRENSTAVCVPKYIYPDEVITAAIAQRWGKYGIDYKLHTGDAVFTRALDAQLVQGKAIFGSGYLLRPDAAAERGRCEAEARARAATQSNTWRAWRLSDRERRLLNT